MAIIYGWVWFKKPTICSSFRCLLSESKKQRTITSKMLKSTTPQKESLRQVNTQGRPGADEKMAWRRASTPGLRIWILFIYYVPGSRSASYYFFPKITVRNYSNYSNYSNYINYEVLKNAIRSGSA